MSIFFQINFKVSFVKSFSQPQIPVEFSWNCAVLQTVPIHGGRERLKKEADHSRLVGGRFNNQGNLFLRLVLVDCKTSRSLRLPAKSYSLYRGLNWVQSCI